MRTGKGGGRETERRCEGGMEGTGERGAGRRGAGLVGGGVARGRRLSPLLTMGERERNCQGDKRGGRDKKEVAGICVAMDHEMSGPTPSEVR